MAMSDQIGSSRDAKSQVRRMALPATVLSARLRNAWQRSSLVQQFLMSASLVMVPAMLVIGLWVSERIRESVTRGAGTSAALYIENIIEPKLQGLAVSDTLADDEQRNLDRLLIDTSLGHRILTFKIWRRDATVISSNRPEVIGQKFTPSGGLNRAWTGLVVSGFDELKDVENQPEKQSGIPLLELYIPIRERGTERIIAVAEFYEKAPELKAELTKARLNSWLLVGIVTLSMLAALFAIVRRGSATIDDQRVALEQRVDELTLLLHENLQLRQRARRASVLASENSEAYLRRLGADLHDGPGQLISLALLRLGEAPASSRSAASPGPEFGEREAGKFGIRDVLTEALADIRNILNGLVLPEIENLTTAETLEKVVARHRKLTGTTVSLAATDLPQNVRPALKQCLYRIVQEGLSNAFRHGGGLGQAVSAQASDRMLSIVVSDQGPGIRHVTTQAACRLGLRALANRVESLGGTLVVDSSPGGGTRLVVRLPLEFEDSDCG